MQCRYKYGAFTKIGFKGGSAYRQDDDSFVFRLNANNTWSPVIFRAIKGFTQGQVCILLLISYLVVVTGAIVVCGVVLCQIRHIILAVTTHMHASVVFITMR